MNFNVQNNVRNKSRMASRILLNQPAEMILTFKFPTEIYVYKT